MDTETNIHACVNFLRLREAASSGAAANAAIANLRARTAEIRFYLGDEARADGGLGERRSDYLRFALQTGCPA